MRARKTLVAGLVAGALCATPAASFAYGPGGGGGGPTAPGFGPTLSSAMIGSAGGVVNAKFNDCHLNVSVPPHAFGRNVTVVISEIKNMVANQQLKAQGQAVCSFGVGFFRNGKEVRTDDNQHLVKLSFTGHIIRSPYHLFTLNQGSPATPRAGKVKNGLAVTRLVETSAVSIAKP